MSHIPNELRRSVAERAFNRCEYYLLHREDHFWSHEIDHIYAEKHGGPTEISNLCLSCADCNRAKGSDLASLDPQTKEPDWLFHPRRDRWGEHFQLRDGVIVGLSAKGRTTAQLLQFNQRDRIAQRLILSRSGRYPRP